MSGFDLEFELAKSAAALRVRTAQRVMDAFDRMEPEEDHTRAELVTHFERAEAAAGEFNAACDEHDRLMEELIDRARRHRAAAERAEHERRMREDPSYAIGVTLGEMQKNAERFMKSIASGFGRGRA